MCNATGNSGKVRREVYSEIKGEIKIVSELPYCLSCQEVIQDFSRYFEY
ncbi:YgiT-type zinc finger protein [Chryseobacterium sp. StRB126]|nr:YgiT-type zinc finger protein [Chryseobacterium sp. StRB126]